MDQGGETMGLEYLQFDYLLRILVAGICGVIIGYERKNRMKEAGIRTHFIVAIGSALVMITSKYGFQDQIGWSNLALDPSRIAAQVVSGIGFLGAGMIFLQKFTIKGLTTAAGIWATSGIGLTIGAGLYWVGVGVTVIILLGQIVLHSKWDLLSQPRTEHIHMRLVNEPDMFDYIMKTMEDNHISVLNFQVEKTLGEIDLAMLVRLPTSYGIQQLLALVRDNPLIVAFEVQQ
jgi:putative Mg2+ transporter-C (MgtC) family protein